MKPELVANQDTNSVILHRDLNESDLVMNAWLQQVDIIVMLPDIWQYVLPHIEQSGGKMMLFNRDVDLAPNCFYRPCRNIGTGQKGLQSALAYM